MPYVLKHAGTGTLLAGFQVNGYELTYYGIYLWDQPPDTEQTDDTLIKAGVHVSGAANEPQEWEPLELTEHEAKMANVKLRNDPRRMVYHRNGVLQAVSVPK
jgi:hypothetical protein